MHALILGGAAEARALAKRLVGEGWFVTFSLAGRVSNPELPAGNVRIGGFGGPAGLTRWLISDATKVIIDVTHPYAKKISESAAEATRVTSIPLVALRRPAWEKQPGDNWIEVSSMQEVADVVADRFYSPFLTIGRQQFAPFAGGSNGRYLIRCVERPMPPLPKDRKIILSHGPYDVAAERKPMRDYAVDCVVTKNSGDVVTYVKIKAARDLKKPVVIMQCPQLPGTDIATVATTVGETYNVVIRRA